VRRGGGGRIKKKKKKTEIKKGPRPTGGRTKNVLTKGVGKKLKAGGGIQERANSAGIWPDPAGKTKGERNVYVLKEV